MKSSTHYDVIIVDVGIPGLETILDSSERSSNLKPLFIAIAGSASNNFRTATLVTRMDSYITRPMDRVELSLQLKACSVLAGKCCIRTKDHS